MNLYGRSLSNPFIGWFIILHCLIFKNSTKKIKLLAVYFHRTDVYQSPISDLYKHNIKEIIIDIFIFAILSAIDSHFKNEAKHSLRVIVS